MKIAFSQWLAGALLATLAFGASAAPAPQVAIETNHGRIVVELYPDKAPATVNNFLRYVKAGFYDNTIFHRVIEDFMIQGGGFTPEFERKQTRAPIENEADNELKNKRGTIAMARRFDPHSATAQFYINVVDNAPLDHQDKTPRGWGYAVFGKVVEGMDVVDTIRQVETGPGGPFPKDAPQQPVIIETITVVETSQEKPAEKNQGSN